VKGRKRSLTCLSERAAHSVVARELSPEAKAGEKNFLSPGELINMP